MRVSSTSITAAIVAWALALTAGCAMPTWHGFGFKSSKSDASSLANAPPAPSFNPAAPQAPTVTMPPAGQTASNLPLYPGTSYPVTPYPAAAPQGAPAGAPAYPSSPPPIAPGYSYGAGPPAVASNPPGPPAGVQSPQYAPPQNPAYSAPPPAGPYNAAGQNGTYTR